MMNGDACAGGEKGILQVGLDRHWDAVPRELRDLGGEKLSGPPAP
jgi:hypothetical protein